MCKSLLNKARCNPALRTEKGAAHSPPTKEMLTVDPLHVNRRSASIDIGYHPFT